MKIRIKFKKYGNVKFIGHLDVQRFFQKAVRRAGIDVAYSTGFSPHQIMSFAAPLGVGLESNGEYMDMEVNSFTGSADTVARLNAASVEGIEILSARVLPEGAGNAMASVAAAGYTVRFREGREPDFPWKEFLADFYAQDSIPITKETKKSTIEMDLKPGIFALKLQEDDSLYMLLDASSSGNIKPAMVLEAYLAGHQDTLKENALLITREDTYTNIGTPESPKFVPLDAIGEEL
ncbi:MAG: TIGR03936 family radical SAM-associated protein [Lachnospiraceae bacterium]